MIVQIFFELRPYPNIFEKLVASWTLKMEAENSTSISYFSVHIYLSPLRHIPEDAKLTGIVKRN